MMIVEQEASLSLVSLISVTGLEVLIHVGGLDLGVGLVLRLGILLLTA